MYTFARHSVLSFAAAVVVVVAAAAVWYKWKFISAYTQRLTCAPKTRHARTIATEPNQPNP